MPALNSAGYIRHGLQSILSQTYPSLEVIVYDDGSSDDTVSIVRAISDSAPGKVHLMEAAATQGVAHARNRLIATSEASNPDAYFMWLDSDDHFIDHCAVETVLTQMLRRDAEICLYNFKIHWEKICPEMRLTAAMMLAEKANHDQLLSRIENAPGQTVSLRTCPDILMATAAGWVKAYAPRARKRWPYPVEGVLYEDNPPMAALLDAERITVVNQPLVNYLRRSGSATDSSLPRHFLVDRPLQLRRFMEHVDASSPAKARAAAGFVEAKLKRAADMLDQLITARHPGFDEGVRAEFERLRSKLIADSRRLAEDFNSPSPRTACI